MKETTADPIIASGPVSRFLNRAPALVLIVYAAGAAFLTYFCMYAFRKPFAAATFDGQRFLNSDIELKTALVISQIIGYTLSKYIGIKICSEMTPQKRPIALILLIVWAESALVLFGILPSNWKIVAILLNGLPLGMIWGLIVWYLEGRQSSEVLLASLSCSYIVSSGVVKDIGRAMLSGTIAGWWAKVPGVGPFISSHLQNVSEGWMPAIVGLHFFPIFCLAVWALQQIPRPNAADLKARGERAPMQGSQRIAFLREFGLGLFLLCLSYFFLTAYRDFRDNYQVEIFSNLGYPYSENRTIISKTETIVMFGVMCTLSLLSLFKDNRRGVMGAFGVMASGMALLGLSTLLYDFGALSGFWWMTLVGLGSYLAYVPYGSVLFERIIASTRFAGTAVFAISLADAIGYTGSVGVQLYRDLAQPNLSRFGFFKGFTYFMSVLGLSCLIASCIYFLRKHPRGEKTGSEIKPLLKELLNT
ncbi:MAG TPA: DUF5690 family protein [Candidatus Saccharimonadales bacterium]|nr:DUF5690 family protein [Candidatus Saccharimonadales bacterium]